MIEPLSALSFLRFKLEFEAEYEGTIGKFVFWDRECNQLLGKTAAEIQQVMVEVFSLRKFNI
jgi:hypothetical protein